jgi:hypothetical protein
MPAIAPQWELTQTTSGVVQIAKGFMIAATADNVQVQALLACESFGNTLAISRHVAEKFDRIVFRQSRSSTLDFLKATVGYAKGNSLRMLGKSRAGINFPMPSCSTDRHWVNLRGR